MTFLRPHLDKHAATLNRWSALDRVNTVGASDVGQCERKVWYTKHVGSEYAAPDDLDYFETYGATLRGTMFETHFWAPALKAYFGSRLLYSGDNQKTFVNGYLSATPDGMVVDLSWDERAAIANMMGRVDWTTMGTEIMVECKTYDPRTNIADPKVENVFQTHVQMGLVRERTSFKPTHSILSYTDASWWNEGPEFVIAFDQGIYDNAKARANRIMNAASADELDPEGWIGGGRDCEYCPFTKACGVVRRRVPDADALAKLDPAFVAEATRLAQTIKNLDETIDTDTTALREHQETLKNHLRNHQARKVPGIVTWSKVKGRAGWDNKAIREAAVAAGVDITPFATEGEPTDRLQITLKS